MQTTTYESPLGALTLVADDAGLRAIRFPSEVPEDAPPPTSTERAAERRPRANASARGGAEGRSKADCLLRFEEASAHLEEARRQLEAYFAGELRRFELTLAAEGTDFQRRVWRALEGIGYGETWSYGQLAAAIGKPTAARAVGLANGRNPLPIVVPCHRVIGADGSLTGYAGGLPLKRSLLALEGVEVP